MMSKNTVNCRKCKHFFITWDVKNPYGCRAMGFKGKKMPSLTVLKNSGKPCLLFDEKKIPPTS
jgi:hypothetical protein